MVKTTKKKKKKTKKSNIGNIFASNSVIFTIIIFVLVTAGYFYRYLVPTEPGSASQVQVPSQPLHTLIEQPKKVEIPGEENKNSLNY